MQGIEQLLIMVIYLFWALVFGFLVIAWRPSLKKRARPVVPVTGDDNCETGEDCDEDIENQPSAQGDTNQSKG